MVTKEITKKATSGKVFKKPRVLKQKKALPKRSAEQILEIHKENVAEPAVKAEEKHLLSKHRYIFATGRRKTAVANVRLFNGKGEIAINKKPLKEYFRFGFYQDEITRPFELTGLVGHYHFTASINGGGLHAQATALRHGISLALSQVSPEVRKVLKKNGFLTRDDRKKERKKPGLKRARRAPQWAKR